MTRRRRNNNRDDGRSVWSWTLTTGVFVGAIAAVIWFIIDPGFEQFLAALAGFLAIVIYFGLRRSRYQRYLDQVTAALILILGSMVVVILIGRNYREQQLAHITPTAPSPDVAVALFEEDERGHLNLLETAQMELTIGEEEILAGSVAIPINLAIRNVGNEPLEIVRVELSYDKTLDVVSEGNAKIDPDNNLLIYEHDIGYLDNIDNFTPLETIDVLHVPFDFVTDPTIVLAKGGVPMYWLVIYGLDSEALMEGEGFTGKVVTFRVRVYSKNHKPFEGIVNFDMDAHVEIIPLPWAEDNESVAANETDIDLFQELRSVDTSLMDGWSVHEQTMGLIEYRKFEYEGNIYQLIFVDGSLRKVNADIGGDGTLDHEIYDETFDEIPDKKLLYLSPVDMVDWPKEAAK